MSRRFPRKMERELSKFLSTVGFREYGRYFWNLSHAEDIAAPAPVPGLKTSLERQVLSQARHDPSVVPMGVESLPNLRRRSRDFHTLYGFSARQLLAGHEVPSKGLLLIPRLDVLEAQSIHDLISMMRRGDLDVFTIVVTEQRAADVSADVRLKFDDCRMVFWQDFYPSEGRLAARLCANFIHASGAAVVISLECAFGAEIIGYYGTALKHCHRLFARLRPPPPSSDEIFSDVHHLRLAAPHATILATSEEELSVLRALSLGVAGPGFAVLLDDGEAIEAALGSASGDARSAASKSVVSHLLRDGGHPIVETDPVRPDHSFDLTVTILFHREQELAIPALASLAQMIETATRDGIRVEVRALLDNADALTRELISQRRSIFDDIRDVSFADPALARNFGVELARGRFLAFVDGDDLWGEDWLRLGYRAAAEKPLNAIWHPEAYLLFYASDCFKRFRLPAENPMVQSEIYFHKSSQESDFVPQDLLLESLWTANSIAAREVFQRFPFRSNDAARQIGIEDWRWNLDTLGHGLSHLVVPDTIHLIRIKEGGSVGQSHDAAGLLPFLI